MSPNGEAAASRYRREHAPAEGQEPLPALFGEVERQFAVMAVNTRKALRARAAAIHPELPTVGFTILGILAGGGDQQQVGLAGQLGADKGTVSRTVKQLQALGLVRRVPDPGDGRAVLVGLTGDGRRRFEDAGEHWRNILHERLRQWDPAEVKRFADLLARLNEAP